MDDRPMSSDEMIKQARDQLADRPDITDITETDEEQRRRIEEIAEAETPSVEEIVQSQAPASRPRRAVTRKPTRIRRVPSGFGEAQPQSRAVVWVALFVALIGLAVGLLVLVASAPS